MQAIMWILALTVLGVACGGKDSGTASPTTPTSGFTLTLSSANNYAYLGGDEQVAAVASDGRAIAGGTWGSDTPAALTVDQNGRVSGVGAGQANIFYIQGGTQGTKLLRGMPKVAGAYIGEYAVSSCNATGQMVASPVCSSDGFTSGTTASYGFSFTQTGESLSGSFMLGSIDFGAFTTTIDVPGTFTVERTLTNEGVTVATTWSLSQRTPSPPAPTFGGTITQVWTAAGVSGSAVVNGTIAYVVKTASQRNGVAIARRSTVRDALRGVLMR